MAWTRRNPSRCCVRVVFPRCRHAASTSSHGSSAGHRACGGRRPGASGPADRSGGDSSYRRASHRNAPSRNRRTHGGGAGGRFHGASNHRAIARSVVQTPMARDQFDAVRRLSFVAALRDGLVLHDVMRDTIAYGLAQRDPNRHITYRLRAWRYLNSVSHSIAKTNRWQYTADLLYLVQNPNVRNAFFRPGRSRCRSSRQASDREAIEGICAGWEPQASGDWLMRWFECHPETFLVGRTNSERVAGFYIIFEHDRVDAALLRSDPITAAWQAHLDANPVLSHERVLFCRRWLSRENGEAPGPIQAAFWVDIKRLYLELRQACAGSIAPSSTSGLCGHRGATWFCSHRTGARSTWQRDVPQRKMDFGPGASTDGLVA